MALGCLDTLRIEYDSAIIPQDISVVGFDGVEAAAWLNYDLTTVHSAFRAHGGGGGGYAFGAY